MSHSSEKPKFKNPLIRWIDTRLPIFSYAHQEYVVYPMPRNLNYFWSFGAIATVMLAVMIISGIFLAMQYTPHVDHAFDSVERIMRDVNYGWLIRYIHMNGASMFFLAVFIHIFRGLYYGSYKNPRELLWILGVVILVLMMATAFMGYVLPWGQMSFWAATVITNLASAIPLVGDSIVSWLWGGFSVGNPTLNRFFALHYLLPFVILAVVVLHVVAMHVSGSNNPAGVEVKSSQDTITFHPFFTAKDSFAIIAFLLFFSAFIFFAPNLLGHPDNYIRANPLSTPAHIVPEWYFLPFYAILRAIDFNLFWIIPAKLGGIIAMFGSLVLLAALPWFDTSPVKSCRYRPIYKWFVFLFAANFVVLTYVGGKPAEGWYIIIAKMATFYYFAHIVIITPIVSLLETPKPLPYSIARNVLGDDQSPQNQKTS
jgi:quinol-cytochrome oxidoreductase complex cytochrome b subunit